MTYLFGGHNPQWHGHEDACSSEGAPGCSLPGEVCREHEPVPEPVPVGKSRAGRGLRPAERKGRGFSTWRRASAWRKEVSSQAEICKLAKGVDLELGSRWGMGARLEVSCQDLILEQGVSNWSWAESPGGLQNSVLGPARVPTLTLGQSLGTCILTSSKGCCCCWSKDHISRDSL